MERKRSVPRLAFPPAFDAAAAAAANVIGKTEPRLAWIALTLAALTAVVDRLAVLLMTDAVYDHDGEWRMSVGWFLTAIVGTFLLGRWARMAGLALAKRASDTVLIDATRRVLAADWRHLDADGQGRPLIRIATEMRRDASRVAVALPALVALPVTAAWLGLYEPGALVIVMLVSIAGAALLRREFARINAGETVLDQAEAAFDRLSASVLAAGAPSGLTSTHEQDTLWPFIDDATRAASSHAQARSRVAGLMTWLAFLLVTVLLAFAPDSDQDSGWTRALIMVVATLHHARQAIAAGLAFQRVGAATAQINAIAECFPVAKRSAQIAPARWTTIAFRNVRVEEQDTPSVFLAAVGPLDIDLHRGEIVALTGPTEDDRGTLLHLLCGLVPPDRGSVLLDGRAISPLILRGLCGGVLDRDPLPLAPSVPGDTARADVLLARFDLPPPMLRGAGVPSVAERIRLAIVITELEDRPIRVYDERATRLEPRFRDAFAEILREARARGRTCIVATEESRVIAAADRVLCMRDGIIVPSLETTA
jgi:putative ATP-binding cassette transporter